jgi:cytochrome P450
MATTFDTALKQITELPGPRGWPLLGNLPQMDLTQFHRRLETWADEYGEIYRFRLGPNNFVVLSEVDAINAILRERPHSFSRRVALERIFDELGFNGVFSADGENWKRQRKIVITALNSAHLNEFYDSMRATTERLQRRWSRAADSGQVIDLCDDLMRYTVDITTQLAFGTDFNTLETDGPVIQQHLDRVFPALNRRLGSPLAYWRYFKLRQDRELDTAVAAIHAQIKQVIEQCRIRMRDNSALFQEPTNFLEAMLAAEVSEGLQFSDDDIVANVFTLLLAGEDTTANTLAWAIYFFSQLPEAFRRVRAEVDAVLGGANMPLSAQEASRLPLVDAFANETMRLKPVAPLTVAETKETLPIAGYSIPPGTAVVLLNRHVAMSARNFANPETFVLDRWLEKGHVEGRVHNPKAFLPFGGGPRFCPGRNLALLEIKVVLAMFCRNFEVALADPAQLVDEVFEFTMSPTNLLVKIQHRR